MTQARYISVILPLKLEWIPSYGLPEGVETPEVGDRVKVVFANRQYVGVVSATEINPDADLSKIKEILSVEHGLEKINPQEIDLWKAIADYYLCSIGEVYKAAYPSGKVNMEEARAVSRRKKKEIHEEEVSIHEIALSEPQAKAYTDVKRHFKSGRPVMLNGVTGSGKTEIYMKLADDALSEGKNVLYLVPEIALSRQLEDRLKEHFGERLLTFHSGKTAAQKRNTAEIIRGEIPDQVRDDVRGAVSDDVRGAVRDDVQRNYIVLGTRSSLFLPHHNLGLIIVDEEHDNSYKQDSPAPRYNGRDTALMLSRIQNCGIILGSATPSLEEMYNCNAGRHALVELKEKFHGKESSDIEIIDTKAERRKNGMIGNFSRKLIDHINKTLERGEQVMILRSRRAWATVLQCESCGEIAKCPHCNVSLSHHRDGRMVCHYCGHTEQYTGSCHKCAGPLISLGAGTQRIEEEAESLFPGARIARLDSDTAQNKTYETRTIRDFAKGNIDILIGTQIVTKGFDFKNLTTVAVIAADALLGIQDFRADEKALQLLEQFRGRCGRRDSKGLFVIQTSQPEHPVYRRLLSNDTPSLNMTLLQERKEFNFPPYSRIVEITVKDIYEDRAERMAFRLASELRNRFAAKGGPILNSPVTGPYAPAVDKVADNYIRTIRVSLKKDRNLTAGKADIRNIVLNFEKSNKYDSHIIINVDPS